MEPIFLVTSQKTRLSISVTSTIFGIIWKRKVLCNPGQLIQISFQILEHRSQFTREILQYLYTLFPLLYWDVVTMASQTQHTLHDFPVKLGQCREDWIVRCRVIWRNIYASKRQSCCCKIIFPKGQHCIWLLLRTIFPLFNDKWQLFGTLNNIGKHTNMFSCMMKK